jgi:uncharacterized protein YxjI
MPDIGYDLEGDRPLDTHQTPRPDDGPSGILPPHFQRDKFLLHQKKLTLSDKYYLYDEQGHPVMFVHREAHHLRSILALLAGIGTFAIAMLVIGVVLFWIEDAISSPGSSDMMLVIFGIATIVLAFIAAFTVRIATGPKRHITFYGDDSKTVPLLIVFQDQKFAFFNITYTIADPDLNMIGLCHKNHIYDLIRKKWVCYDAQGATLCIVREDSAFKSLLRRLLGNFYGLLRTNFNLYGPDDDRLLGAFNRKFTLVDKYVLDMTRDPTRQLDRRMAVAIGVLLDTGERR